MGQLKIHPLPIIKIKTPKGGFTYLIDAAKTIYVPVYSWYIEGTKEKILIDTGCSAEMMETKRGIPSKTMLTPFDALRKVGISPEEIDIVILTHLHIDHIGFAHLYKRAKFIVQKAELEAARNPHPVQRLQFRDMSTFEGLNFEIVEGDTQVVKGVELLLTPGHTAGTQSVVLDTEKGKAIIAGMCSIRENFEPPAEVKKYMPVIASGIHLDARLAYDSVLRVKHKADIVIPIHEPAFVRQDTIP
jgi:glyoxylase-like metal-dependent hydrolase (beta-lactamase superfamily II)